MIPWDGILIPWEMKTSTDTISNDYLPFQRKPKHISREQVVVHFDTFRIMKGWELRGPHFLWVQDMPRTLLLEPSSHGTLSRDPTHSANSIIMEKSDRIWVWVVCFCFCFLNILYSQNYLYSTRFVTKIREKINFSMNQ